MGAGETMECVVRDRHLKATCFVLLAVVDSIEED